MHILCRLGFHNERDLWRERWDGREQTVRCKCLRCGKEAVVTFVSPLSGPRTGPMHPEAERRYPAGVPDVIVPLFPGINALIAACKGKDAELYARLSSLPAGRFWKEWKAIYPEDFPQGGESVASADCILPRPAMTQFGVATLKTEIADGLTAYDLPEPEPGQG
jgi:hypothetical protein